MSSNQKGYFVPWVAQEGAKEIEVQSAINGSICTPEGVLFDFMSGNFHGSFGYGPKRILNSIQRGLEEIVVGNPKFRTEKKNKATALLKKFIEDPFHQNEAMSGRIFYTTSGAESVENALKIVRSFKGQTLIGARKNAYHGATLGALSVTGDWRNQANFTVDDWTMRLFEPEEDPCFEKNLKLIQEKKPIALIFESISGTNGVSIPPMSYWMGVKEAQDRGVLIILDEVFTGFFRTGARFGFSHFLDSGIRPDLITMGKAISGGLIPFGAVWVREKIAAHFDQKILVTGTTQYANPLGLSAMIGALESFDDEFLKKIKEQSKYFFEVLERVSAKSFKSKNQIVYWGKGFLAAVESEKEFDLVQAKKDGVFLYQKKISKNNQDFFQLILSPPFGVDVKDFEAGCEKLEFFLSR